jgi:glycosyltransferase involved in cell wall biosynthesis
MMPAYNAEKYIEEAIKSVLAQSYTHWELIVVDDGSTDGTAGIVASFDDPRIKLLRQSNGGESVARNTALRHMHGEFVAFLDADDMYLANHLTLTMSFLKEHPQFNGVYSDGYYYDSSGKLLKTLTSRRRGPFQGDIFAEAVRGSDLFGPPVSVVLERNLIVEHKLQFDEEITIGPDWVFLMQFASVGKFGYLDDYTCLYRIHDTNISLRVDLQRRAREHAKCRMRAINMDRFNECPVDVRAIVFYDLLILSLRDFPEKQIAVTHLPQFQLLLPEVQARLLRLMASRSMLEDDVEGEHVRSWLQKSYELDPTDMRAIIFRGLYNFSPQLSKRLLEIKRKDEADPLTISPFADINSS